MRDQNGEIIYDYSAIPQLKKYENMTPQEVQKDIQSMSNKKLKEIAPVFTLGMAIKQTLSKNIPIESDNELAMKVFKFLDRVNNILENNDGKWNVDSDEIKKLQDILSKAKGQLSALVMGQILSILEEFSAELVIKNKKV